LHPDVAVDEALDILRQDIARVESKIKTDRELDDEQLKTLTVEFEKASGKGVVFVTQSGNDEAIRFSDQIEGAAKKAGLEIKESILAVHSEPVSGVQLQYPDKDLALKAVAEALRD